MHGVEEKQLVAGGTYLKVHYYADPDKDDEWLEATRKSMIDTPRQFEVEILMKELFLDGQVVFSTFNEAVHVPDGGRDRLFGSVPNSTYIVGWDCGSSSVNPAAVLVEVTPRTKDHGRLVLVHHEWTTEAGTSLEVFVPAVLNDISQKFRHILFKDILHCGDETGRNKTAVSDESGFDVMARLGVFVTPVTNAWGHRRGAVDRLLADRDGSGVARMCINAKGCPILVAGFNGGYRLKQITSGSSDMYGMPVKDKYSHPHDGLQYAAVVACELMDGGGKLTKNKL